MKPKTVLYVDDEEEYRDLVRALLEAAGFRVRTAGGVVEAMSIAFADFPDLVITDIMMPGESGFSLCTRLRNDPSTASIPILVLTLMEEEHAALEAGATAFLSKPIEQASLLRTVADILRPAGGREALDRALRHLRLGQRLEAKRQLEDVLRVDGEGALSKWARYYLAQLEHIDGSTARAIQVYHAILDRDPAFWRAHNRLGLIHEMSGEQDLARSHYRQSMALNPSQPYVGERLDGLAG